MLKTIGLVLAYITAPSRARNLRVVLWLLVLLLVLVAIFSTLFHLLMAAEDRQFAWITGVYWTMTVMSTLGLGDITFQSGAGQVFTVVVLVTGTMFILIIFPFTFIQFVFVPWVEQRNQARAPRKLPPSTSGHIILTDTGTIEDAVIRRAKNANVPYVVIVPALTDALARFDQGYKVMVGDLDSPDTYRNAQVENASLVAATNSDPTNTNIAFTIREIDPAVPIVATANAAAAVDVLDLAGCSDVLQLGDMLGRAIAQRVLGTDARAHVIDRIDTLGIAEASPAGTALVGTTLREARLRERFGVTAVGFRRRGQFTMASADTPIDADAVLILAGELDHLEVYSEAFGVDRDIDTPVIIIGGGRVGRAAGRALARAGLDYRIIEQRNERIRDPDTYVHGDAAQLSVLQEAGIEQASAVLVTTHDDDINVFLTIFARKLRPDVQIIARSNLDRNVSTLHRAGADAVLSYASIGSMAIWNTLEFSDTVVLAEGLDIFQVSIPPSIVGRSLAEVDIRAHTGCTVVAVQQGDRTDTNPDPAVPLPRDAELVIVGTSEGAREFHHRYPSPGPGPR